MVWTPVHATARSDALVTYTYYCTKENSDGCKRGTDGEAQDVAPTLALIESMSGSPERQQLSAPEKAVSGSVLQVPAEDFSEKIVWEGSLSSFSSPGLPG